MSYLARKIRKRSQLEIASAQDIVVERIFQKMPEVVLHGGTLIWRCYGGNRFSQDLDFYAEKKEAVKPFFEELSSYGFMTNKLRIKDKSAYIKLTYGRIELSVELLFKHSEGTLLNYETLEGRKLMVRGLDPETVIIEKVNAFLSRKKARDLYDIVHMLSFASRTEKVKNGLELLIENYERPMDEEELKATVIVGYAPGADEMLDSIRRWLL